MTETAEEYKSRFAAYVEGKDPIAMQRDTPDTIATMIASVTPARLRQPPTPGKWSVLQIIAHLAEDELASSWRYRQMLEYDGPELTSFDQDLWARLGDYSSWEPADALTMFRLLRQANLRMFARLTPQQWQRHGTHTERGKVTMQELCRHMAAHDVNHIEQIKRILNFLTAS